MTKPMVAFVTTALLWLGLTVGGTSEVASAGTPIPGAPSARLPR